LVGRCGLAAAHFGVEPARAPGFECGDPPSRVGAALVSAARALLAEGMATEASVQEIADRVRMTIRMVETHPELAQVLRRRGLEQLDSEVSLAPRALRDIEAGVACGRFAVADPLIALSAVGGSLLGLLQLESVRPEVVGAEAGERPAALILRMLGLPPDEADTVARRPLPLEPPH
jgi:hypothetical protein